MNTETGTVDLVISGEGIATVTFFHPAQNSMPSALLELLAQTITDAGNQAPVIILKSGGDRTFCAGASFDELVQISTKEEGDRFFSGFANVINACRKSPAIIIGRVQGKAVGGGVGLAAAADYCFATQHAAVKLSELTIGIGPFVIAPAVRRKMGLRAFTELSLLAADFKSAGWAQQNGLYNAVFDTAEQMDEALNSLARQLASYNPEALSALKSTFWQGTEDWDDLLKKQAAISGELVTSTFTRTALQRYASKKV